jgi:hypothetical protein
MHFRYLLILNAVPTGSALGTSNNCKEHMNEGIPCEQYQAPRSWAERAYPKLIYCNRAEKDGHFAAWEQPQLFSEELRAAFRSLP